MDLSTFKTSYNVRGDFFRCQSFTQAEGVVRESCIRGHKMVIVRIPENEAGLPAGFYASNPKDAASLVAKTDGLISYTIVK